MSVCSHYRKRTVKIMTYLVKFMLLHTTYFNIMLTFSKAMYWSILLACIFFNTKRSVKFVF